MIKKILLIQPFSLLDEQLSNILLTWPIYLENYLKSKCPNLEFDILYLPVEQKIGNIKLKSYDIDEIMLFEKQMNYLISKLEFIIDQSVLICISCTFSSLYIPTRIIVNYFKKYFYNSIIIIGGAHISACNEEFIESKSSVDYIVQGEGEIPLYKLIKRNPKKRQKPILLRKEIITNLDDLPLIDFSNLSISKYLKHFSNLSISLSRGCPYNCHFCMEKTLSCQTKNVKRWRVFSPSRALVEVKNMIRFGSKFNINEYGFIDSIFGMNKNWLNRFLDLYCFEDYCSNWIETRLDILDEKLIIKLDKKKFFIMYGLESLSPEILKIMNKTITPRNYIEKFWEILNIHKKLDNVCAINIIISHPGETEKSIKETFQGLEKIVMDEQIDKIYLNIRYYHNYPGTFVYNNINHFNEKYGTKAYPLSINWWRSTNLEIQKYGPFCVRPSKKLSLRQSIDRFFGNYFKLNEINIKKLKNNKLDNKSYIQKILTIKKTNYRLEKLNNEITNFLNVNQIEVI